MADTPAGPAEALAVDPWGTLGRLLDGPLHPGGREATRRLLDRADVTAGTRLLDVGCGCGDAVTIARERGARAVGLDCDPGSDADHAVRGDLAALPVADGALDAVLAECVLCLADDRPAALAEAHRALRPGGRLAVSDVVVSGSRPDLPAELVEAFCLGGDRSRDRLLADVETADFAVADVRNHRDDLLTMRDRIRARVDYEGLLGALGDRGDRLLAGIERLESAVEDETVGYVSLVATAE